MATPRYVAKKVGDQYELVRQDPDEAATAALYAASGGCIALCGLLRGGLLGKMAMAVGAGFIYRAVTGRDPVECAASWFQQQTAGSASQTPSYPHDYRRRAGQVPEDAVEETSMESFPASDPPGVGQP